MLLSWHLPLIEQSLNGADVSPSSSMIAEFGACPGLMMLLDVERDIGMPDHIPNPLPRRAERGFGVPEVSSIFRTAMLGLGSG